MKPFFILIALTLSSFTFGQAGKTIDFLYEIQKYDISYLLTLDKFQAEDDTAYIPRDEPLGFIGDNYQRFYIHFISVIQNPQNKFEYFVYGKTKVKDNICSFQGLLTINEAGTYYESDLPPLKQGFVKGDYNFFQDPAQAGTGTLSGKFKTNFYLDKNGCIKYDALMYVADSFNNNQFEGTWTSYQTKETKKCNWGDYRIPDSGDFDMGAGEFYIDEKYVKNGWENFVLAYQYDQDNPQSQQARQKENEAWWK